MKVRDMQAWLVARVAEAAGLNREAVDIQAPFYSFGLTSRDAVTVSGELEELLARPLAPTLLYEYPNIAALAAQLADETVQAQSGDVESVAHGEAAIAIVGMACRFPGARDPHAFWQLLCEGRDVVREVPRERWRLEDVYHEDVQAPGRSISRWGAFLDGIDGFDPFFFGISPGEAERMDPQQRLLLELAWECLEDANLPAARIAGSRAGVFIGISVNEYAFRQLEQSDRLSAHSGTGTALSVAANRISYFFDLHGPSMAIDTACSSSLVAVHQACRSLRSGECRLALAGGANVVLSPLHSIVFSKAGVLARDGRCKVFDARADGYVRGEGAGVVALKRLADALADGDDIHAVIRGSAVHQDGRTNGLMAPSREAQEEVLRAACEDADIDPRRVQYVEAHGTGTLLGDAMEAAALGAVLGGRADGVRCRIGSVKSNFGHLEAAAGIAGLIKVALSLRHRTLPPSLHYHSPNPHIAFDKLGLEVQSTLAEWPEQGTLRCAGVSSFGFGGTNAHVVLEEHMRPKLPADGMTRVEIVPLSAFGPRALTELVQGWRDAASSAGDRFSLAELAAAAARRTSLRTRVAFCGRTLPHVAEAMTAFLENGGAGSGLGADAAEVAFVFSGQGGQWPGMGRELWHEEPCFRAALKECADALAPFVDWSLEAELNAPAEQSRLGEIDVAQPVIWGIQVALARLLESWGVRSSAVIGHSLGEVAAAHLAGALSLADAASVICERSRLLRTIRGRGRMAVVALSSDETAAVIAESKSSVSLAACNSPGSSVVAGDLAGMASFQQIMERRGVWCSPVNVDVASHGPQTRLLAEQLRADLQHIRPREAHTAFYSTVSGGRHQELLDAAYWAANLEQPVQFAAGIDELLRSGFRAFVELGPHPVLVTAVQQCAIARDLAVTAVPLLRREEPEREVVLAALAALFTAGVDIDFEAVAATAARRLPVPHYPWQRERYWLSDTVAAAESSSGAAGFLDAGIEVATSPGRHLWQTTVSAERVAFLADHRINGEVIAPLALFVELLLEAAHELAADPRAELADLVLQQPLALRESRLLQVEAEPAGADGSRGLTVRTRTRTGGGAWLLHATATLRTNAGGRAAGPRFERPEEAIAVPAADVYNSLGRHGMEYGPALRLLTEAWHDGTDAYGRVDVTDELAEQAAAFRIHPALLDASLHALAAITPAHDGGTYVPAGCQAVRVTGRVERTLWCQAALRESSATGFTCDVRLFDEEGVCFFELLALRFAPIATTRRALESPQQLWQYEVGWRGDETAVTDPLESGTRWLIAARGELADEVARALRARAQECVLLDPASADSLPEVAMGCERVLFLADAGADVNVCSEAMRVVQSLGRPRAHAVPRLWLVTVGAQPVLSNDPGSPLQATLWGLGRTIAFELPDLQCRLVDLDPRAARTDAVGQLIRELAVTDAEGLVGWRHGQRYVARLVAVDGDACPTIASAEVVRSDGTYLVTGGLGGLGLEVARWLARSGAQSIVLFSRREPDRRAQAVLDGLRAAGVRVEVLQVDVSSGPQVQQAVAEVRRRLPPLRGVVHAAGVLDNVGLLDMTARQLERVLAPKVQGGWHLHTATAAAELDWFVLFSSAVTVLGSPGQANYAAANAFLDVLAKYRRTLGLPATAINWGPWAEVGLVAEGFRDARAGSRGIKSIAPDAGIAALEALIRARVVQRTVLPFDLAGLLELYPAAAAIPLFADVGGGDTHVARLYARPAMTRPYVAPRTDTERKLAQLWRHTLRIDQVGVHDSFFELGGDSVLAAQIVSAAHRTFGVGIDLKDAFEAFTVEHLSARLDLALSEQAAAAAEQSSPRLPATATPLSFVQERQLFLELLEPGSAVNNLCMAMRVEGIFSPERIADCARHILSRHQVLRTGFGVVDGLPAATIAAAPSLAAEVTEVPGGIPEAMQLAAEESARPFSLSQAPLIRLRVFRIDAELHVLLIVVHHGIADGWSLGIFIDELFTLYHARDGAAAALPPLPMQYGDFARRQRAECSRGAFAQDLAYWKDKLAGELPVLDLPTDRPRGTRQSFAGATHRVALAGSIWEDLREFSRGRDCTPFMVMVSAFAVLLHRLTGQADLLIGTPTAGRTSEDLQRLIGAFINTLVLRVDTAGAPHFDALLGQVRSVAMEAYAHQQVPFERIVAELRPQRDLSRTAVFQVMFNLQNAPLPLPQPPGLVLSLLPVDRGATQFDLTVIATPLAGAVDLAFEYNSDLFDQQTVAQWADLYRDILTRALARPTAPISELARVADAEQHALLALNRTAVAYDFTADVAELVAGHARARPDTAAVVCGEIRLSYGELGARANAVAAQLTSLGVASEEIVAVMLQRSAYVPAVLLGILQAGAAYLPIDPATPHERVRHTLADAGVRVLLSDCEAAEWPGVKTVAPTTASLPFVPTRPGETAYVIYTSGSTGQPKGVVVSRRALLNLLFAMQDELACGAGDVWLAVTSLAFDIAALEIFLPLVTGGTVVIAGSESVRDPLALRDALSGHGVTIMQATPALWRLLVHGGWGGGEGIRILCGGEALAPALAAELLKRSPSVWNLYGPTETTIWSAASRLERGRPVTIGRPLANTQLYVLDEDRQLLPVGVVGELYIGGAGVALGYLGKPALTAERFIPDPFAAGDTVPARLFRTGDRARVLHSGEFEVLGRVDDQVKVHGFRVELGDVEAALSRHAGVREAAVVARDGAVDTRHLVAFVVGAQGVPVDGRELRAFLRESLPAYMVPTVFVCLRELPRTVSGKIDRGALPVVAPAAAVDYVAPRTDTETALARAYAAVLAVPQVGVHDNFFDLGGGSIQILEIIVRVQEQLGLALSPEQFFEYQSVAELAEALREVSEDA